jgi:hypothetical protein
VTVRAQDAVEPISEIRIGVLAVTALLNKASELLSDAVCQLIFARRRQGLAGTQLPSSARSRPEGYSATTRAKTTEAEQQTPWGVPQIRVSDSA